LERGRGVAMKIIYFNHDDIGLDSDVRYRKK
jgi:hypothetical protein